MYRNVLFNVIVFIAFLSHSLLLYSFTLPIIKSEYLVCLVLPKTDLLVFDLQSSFSDMHYIRFFKPELPSVKSTY